MNAKPEFFRVCSDFFVWTGNVGVCDITDLPPEMPTHKSVRESFDVVSSKTGKVETFHFRHVLDRNGEEILGWRYATANGALVIDIAND